MAEGEGFEPPDGLPHLLISSQVPLTTQPPFPPGREMNQAHGQEASPGFEFSVPAPFAPSPSPWEVGPGAERILLRLA